MYVLSHGCLLSLYKVFFNLHTRVCLSCALTFGGCKCLFIVYAFFLWEASFHESCLVSHGLLFRSRYHILDIVLHDRLVLLDHSFLPFLLVYFFIAGRLRINDVAQQCHITRVCLRPLSFFGILVVLLFILDYSASTILFILFWSSSFRYGVVDPRIFRFLLWTIVTCF